MVLKTDKQLSFSSEIASTIGLEEAILLQVLTDVSNLSDEIKIEGNYWNSISFEKLKSILQFWNQDDIDRVFSNLSNIGILRTNNSREKNDSLTYSLRTAISSKKLEHSKFFNNSSNQIKSDSIEGMSLHWSPNEETLRQLEQLGVTKEFSKDLVDEFKLIKEDFCFLHVGHWLQGNMGEDRKDISMLVKTFLETFKNQKNQPALILKTSGATPCILDRSEIFSKIEDIKKSVKGELPNIYVLHGDLRDEEINQLYNHPKVKAHISFTHGEGFGRPLLEATLSEKPVVASNWSGKVDFLSKDSLLLPGDLIDVPKNSLPKEFYVKGCKWFQVNYQYASNVMKELHKNYTKYQVKAKKQAIMNKQKFSLDSMTKVLDEILDKHLPKFEEQPQKVDIKLPTLKKVSKPKKVELPKLKKVN